MNLDLNLVPFIDLLSVCITFLIATAVWLQMSAIQVDQKVADPNQEQPPPPDEPPVPPMAMHISADGIYVGRNKETGKEFPQVAHEYDWRGIDTFMKEDHEKFPEELDIIIATDDGVNYQHMVRALDMARSIGYENTLLAGGPPAEDKDKDKKKSGG